MPTLGETVKVYVKPSLKGRLILRKPTSEQASARLAARKQKVAAAGSAGLISKAAHDELVAEGKCTVRKVYVPGKGYTEKPVCPIRFMIPKLRAKMAAIA
jgi:hypothetical protein